MFFILYKKRLSTIFPECLKSGPKSFYTELSGQALVNVHDFLLNWPETIVGNNNDIETIKFVKDRKYILRIRTSLIPGPQATFIFKIFLFNKIRHRFRNIWMPLDELFNLLAAKARGVPTPDIYGLYTLSDKAGLTKQAGIAMQDLAGFETLLHLFQRQDGKGRGELLGAISSAIKVLYENGCHHVDLNPGAVLVNPDDCADFRIIDFQHAKFFDTPNVESFLFMISHLAQGIRPIFEEAGNGDELDRWIIKVVGSLIPSINTDYINQRIGFYNSHDFRRKHRELIGTKDFEKLSRGVLKKAAIRRQAEHLKDNFEKHYCPVKICLL